MAPFITSTLQQEASRKLRFSVKRTMMLAQRLYEGVELGKEGAVGLITYMRTDSTRISDDALDEVREFIGGEVRRASICRKRRTFTRSKKDAQDAHEAIRPTSVMRTPDEIARVPGRRRAEALPADLDALRGVADEAGGVRSDHHRRDGARARTAPNTLFRATGSVLKFDGFLKVYEEGKDQKDEEDEELKHKLPAGDGRRGAEVPRHQARAALHRAAAALQRSHAGEETGSPTAWAGPPPTPPFSPPSRNASTSRRKAASSSPPNWAWW